MSMRKKSFHSFAIAIAVLACWSTAANAQVPSGAPGPEAGAAPPDAASANEEYLLRTYDVGDLVITVRDYPYSGSTQSSPPVGGSGGGGGGGIGGGGWGGGGWGGGGGAVGGGGGVFSVPDEKPSRSQSKSQSSSRTAPIILLCQAGPEGVARPNPHAPGAGGGRPGGEPGGMRYGRPGGDQAPQPIASGPDVTMGDLIRVLTNTVAFDTWEINGGAQGRVEPLGTALIVWQTARVQKVVESFLKQIRETSGNRHTLTIDARWLLLTSDELDTLAPHAPLLDPKALEKFTRRPGTIRGITNCFSGQLVYLVSGTKRNVISGWIPVVGSIENPDQAATLVSLNRPAHFQLVAETSPFRGRDASVGYQPIVETPNFGALLEIRPTTMGSSDVIVDLKSTLTAPSEQVTERSRGTSASDGMAPAVDRIAIETQELATTMRVPAGKPVLVGGMTYVPGSARPSEDAKSPEHPQLYLVLEIR